MIRSDIIERLYSLQDVQYRDFQSKLIPNISADSVIGVRLPGFPRLNRWQRSSHNARISANFSALCPTTFTRKTSFTPA